MLNALRSLIFNIFYIFGSFFCSVFLLWTFIFPPEKCVRYVSLFYKNYMEFIERFIMGMHLELRGLENLPKDTPCIIAAKHQSAFETLNMPFMPELGYPIIILKKELTRLPVWGLFPKKLGFVAIDRSLGAESIRAMNEGCKKALASGRGIIIYPQGTRVKVGDKKPYKPGLAKLYKDLGVPIVPMALNTGVFWPRNSFLRKPGKVVYQFLPAIPPGRPPLQVMAEVERVIEEATDQLVAEAKTAMKPPHKTTPHKTTPL